MLLLQIIIAKVQRQKHGFIHKTLLWKRDMHKKADLSCPPPLKGVSTRLSYDKTKKKELSSAYPRNAMEVLM